MFIKVVVQLACVQLNSVTVIHISAQHICFVGLHDYAHAGELVPA